MQVAKAEIALPPLVTGHNMRTAKRLAQTFSQEGSLLLDILREIVAICARQGDDYLLAIGLVEV